MAESYRKRRKSGVLRRDMGECWVSGSKERTHRHRYDVAFLTDARSISWQVNMSLVACRHAEIVSKRIISGKRIIFRDQKPMKDSSHPQEVAQGAPDRIALRMVDLGDVLTYGELVADSNRLARLFGEMGLCHGETIACLLANGPDLWRVVWAAKNAGLRYVLVGTRLNVADVGFIVQDSGAKVLVTSMDFVALAEQACRVEHGPCQLLVDGDRENFLNLGGLAEKYASTPLADRRRGASMLYSSGTTGRPKGVKVKLVDVPPEVPPPRHALLLANYAIGPDTVFLTAAPFYHAGPLRIAMAVQRAGGTVIAMRKFDARAVLEAIGRFRVTHAFFVPTMFQRLLDLPESLRAASDTSSLRHAIHGAAPCPAHVKRAMIDWWGPVIDELYGGTESIGQTFISSREWLLHPGSVGKPAGHVEVKIIDAAGNRLPPCTSGRVMMRNPQRFEYHGAAAIDAGQTYDAEGFASLGDIGYLDEEGYLYLTDRESNMIISGGVNIYPQEAEAVLLAHPSVADAAVIGIADRDLGEVAKALVALAPGASASAATAAAILNSCAERLSLYKCPRSLDFVEEVPRNELGKLVKRQIPQSLCESPGPFTAG